MLLRSVAVVFAVGMVGGLSGLMFLPTADSDWSIIANAPIPDPKPVPCKQQARSNADRSCAGWTAPRSEGTKVAEAKPAKGRSAHKKDGRKVAAASQRPVVAAPLAQKAAVAEKPAEHPAPARPVITEVSAGAEKAVITEVASDEGQGMVARVLAYFSRTDEPKPAAVAAAPVVPAPKPKGPVIVDLPIEAAYAPTVSAPPPAAETPAPLDNASLRPSMPTVTEAAPSAPLTVGLRTFTQRVWDQVGSWTSHAATSSPKAEVNPPQTPVPPVATPDASPGSAPQISVPQAVTPPATPAPSADLLSPQPLGLQDAAELQPVPAEAPAARTASAPPAAPPVAAVAASEKAAPPPPARPVRSVPRREDARIAVTTIAPDGSRRIVMVRPQSRQDHMYYAARPQVPVGGGGFPFGGLQ